MSHALLKKTTTSGAYPAVATKQINHAITVVAAAAICVLRNGNDVHFTDLAKNGKSI